LKWRPLPDTTERLTLALFYVKERVRALLAGTTTDYEREMLADKILGLLPEEEEEEEESIYVDGVDGEDD
jgi:hypothetical protein